MENLYAFRDAFFWWAGVWATVTLGNHAVNKALKRRKCEEREHEYAQRKREFAEFLFSMDAPPETETDEPEERDETMEPEAAPEDSETANAEETAEN